jgi:hypothetical protein
VRSEACFGKAGGCSDLVLRCSGAGQQRRTVVSECGRARSGVEPWCARRQGSARRLTLLARACLCTWVDFRGYRKQASKQATRGEEGGGAEGGGKVTSFRISIDQLNHFTSARLLTQLQEYALSSASTQAAIISLSKIMLLLTPMSCFCTPRAKDGRTRLWVVDNAKAANLPLESLSCPVAPPPASSPSVQSRILEEDVHHPNPGGRKPPFFSRINKHEV